MAPIRQSSVAGTATINGKKMINGVIVMGSDFAEQITGADNICERSAVLCSGGSLIIRKTARDGVTAAAAEIPVEIDFEKRRF